jgi:tryptophan synthase alpha chain
MAEVNGVPLGAHLRAARSAGRKLLVPYMTGCFQPGWVDVVAAYVEAGADAIEIGFPVSDPVMDGPTIQAASARALQNGATPMGILSELRGFECPVPLVVMTYYNLVYRAGLERFAAEMAEAGVLGIILPDVPLEELGPWHEVAAAHGIETVGLVGPITPDDRMQRVCDAASGFIYGVNLMGVTGERADVSADSAVLAGRIRAVTDLPAIMGFGISTPEQAASVASNADGVIVASAIMHRLLDGGSADDAGAFVAELRTALDQNGS